MRGSMKDWRIIKRMTEAEDGYIYKTKRYVFRRNAEIVTRVPIMAYRMYGEKAFLEYGEYYCNIKEEAFGEMMK